MTALKIAWGLFLIVTAASATTYFLVPADTLVPVHWGIDGQPDRYGSTAEGLLLMPAILFLILLLFSALKWLEPRQENLQKSATARGWIALSVTLLLAILSAGSILTALGQPVPMVKLVVAAVTLSFIIIGNFLPKTRSNFYIGVRTPWTLSSDENWQKTHRLAGRLMMLAGLLGFVASLLLPVDQLWLIILLLVTAGLVPVIYSWWIWLRARPR